MTQSAEGTLPLEISADHPSLPGHFPGNPVVPGVVILDAVITALQNVFPQHACCGVRKIKYLQPLSAGTVFLLEHAEPKQGSLRFKCRLQDTGELLAEGNLLLAAVAPTEATVA